MTGRLELVVVGLDISQTATGISDGRSAWRIGQAGHRGESWRTRGARIRRLGTEVHHAVRDLHPCLIMVEGPAYSRNDPGLFDRAGLWWSIVNRLTYDGQHRIVVVDPRNRAKYPTGNGNADKPTVLAAVQQRWPQIDVHGDHNQADAVSLAAIGYHYLHRPLPGAAADTLFGAEPWMDTVVADVDWDDTGRPVDVRRRERRTGVMGGR